jgi:hypothetical protein
MRIDLKGIHPAYAKLAHGSIKFYCVRVAWWPPLRCESESPDFIVSYNEAVAQWVLSPECRLHCSNPAKPFGGLKWQTRRPMSPI